MYRRNRNFTKKLTDEQVIEILNDKTTDVDVLAQRYNVTRRLIGDVYAGRSYKYITRSPEYAENRRILKYATRKLDEDIVRAIKNNERKDFEAIAQEYGVTVKHLKNLRNPNNFDCWK